MPEDQDFFLQKDAKEQGPYSLRQLQDMWNSGYVTSDMMWWTNSLRDWQPISTLADKIKANEVRISEKTAVREEKNSARGFDFLKWLLFPVYILLVWAIEFAAVFIIVFATSSTLGVSLLFFLGHILLILFALGVFAICSLCPNRAVGSVLLCSVFIISELAGIVASFSDRPDNFAWVLGFRLYFDVTIVGIFGLVYSQAVQESENDG